MACSSCGSKDPLQQAALQIQQSSAASTVKLNTSNNAIIFGKPKIVTK